MSDPRGPLLPLVGRDPNVPRDVRLVGRYAIGIEWQDEHSSILRIAWQDSRETTLGGRELRMLCRCAACTTASTAP